MKGPDIDTTACNGCGLCVEVCPRGVIQREAETRTAFVPPNNRETCSLCAHCAAICPQDAVSMQGYDPGDIEQLPSLDIRANELLAFLKSRRSIRNFKEKHIPDELLKMIVDAALSAPAGLLPSEVGIVIIRDEKNLTQVREELRKTYRRLRGMLRRRIPRLFIKRALGARELEQFEREVLPVIETSLNEGAADHLTYNCRAVIVFHCPRRSLTGAKDCIYASACSLFAAHALGIGTCISDTVASAVDNDRELRKILGIPGDRRVETALLLGWPKYRFRKTIKRRLASVVWE